MVASDMPSQKAVDVAIRHLGDMGERGGIILMTRDGAGISFNTGAMSTMMAGSVASWRS